MSSGRLSRSIKRLAAQGKVAKEDPIFVRVENGQGGLAHMVESMRWRVRGGGSRRFRWLVRAFVILLIGGLLLIPYHHHVTGPCRIVPSIQLGLRAQIADQIIEIHRSSGDWVEAGDLVATLAAREERTAVEAARAQLRRAQAQVELLRMGPQPEIVSVARQRVSLWELQLDYLTSEWERVQELYQEQAASLADLQRAKQLRDTAENNLISARESLAGLEKGARPQEIEAAEAEAARIQAQLAGMEEILQLSEIKAPMAGRLVTDDLESRLEQHVLPGDLIAEIHNPGTLRAEMAADESAAIHVKRGMRVNIRLWSLGGKLLTGRVESVSSTVDPESELWTSPIRSDRESQARQTFLPRRDAILVEVELDDPPDSLAAGMTGEAKISVAANPLGMSLLRPVIRFFRVEVWSWLP